MVNIYFAKLEEQINLFKNIVVTYTVSTKYYSRSKGYIIGNIV